jgi:nucleotide-binding universal stress UspA family protein
VTEPGPPWPEYGEGQAEPGPADAGTAEAGPAEAGRAEPGPAGPGESVAGGSGGRVVVWVTEGTWQASVDAAAWVAPAAADITLLYVTPADLAETAHGAYLGLFGRGQEDDPGPRVAEIEAESATELLDAAAARLGRECQRAERQGRPEREVVAAADGASLLIVARDGDRSRLGPKSLGKEVRFVVDHAPCPVLLIWPEPAPSTGTIPPPPPKGHKPPKPPKPHKRHGPHHDW